jgi:acetyl/propionyl-CoA carboxylase alpha subunit
VGDIRRLLIANRGEIAVRVIRACRESGISPIAVVAPGDRAGMHADLADDVLEVPSYLDATALVAAAAHTGADAVHPGYGFLSEDPGFAERVRAAGLGWIGPPPEAMRLLADKIAARQLARSAGVDIVPGCTDDEDDALIEGGRRLGVPLVVKAAGGGGGRGMRSVDDLADLPAAIAAARREAAASFGDDRVFVERRIAGGHHIEVQLVLDEAGGAVTLGERECSLQRRHQKIVEEAPSPVVDEALRAALSEAAIAVARAAGYRGVGTVEFLLDGAGEWSFLEMNARLQVEHAVTEAVAGMDLVRTQLGVAAGERLHDPAWPRPAGHAIEARIYAEDPAAGFVPSAGRVELLELPHWPGVRIDSALRQGEEIGLGYDPLVAKVIAAAEDRPACLARLRAVLADVRIVGVATNLGFLLDALAHPDVVEGRADIDWVESAWRPSRPSLPDGVRPDVEPGDPWYAFDGAGRRADVAVAGGHAQYLGWDYLLREDDDLESASVPGAEGALAAPLPASVRSVHASAGEAVGAGQVLVVLEAMKMQLTVDAPADGVVGAVLVRPGDVVAAGQALVEMKEP